MRQRDRQHDPAKDAQTAAAETERGALLVRVDFQAGPRVRRTLGNFIESELGGAIQTRSGGPDRATARQG